MRGGAVAARRAHNPEVLGSNPSPATRGRSLPETTQAFFASVVEEKRSLPETTPVVYTSVAEKIRP